MRFLFIYFLLIPLFLQAQDWEAKKLAFIEEIATYRASLIQEDFEKMALYAHLIKKWHEEQVPEKIQIEVLFRIPLLIDIYKYSFSDVLKYLKEYYADFEILQKITETEANIIAQNSNLIDLSLYGILSKGYPFIIRPESSIFRELDFYQIRGDEVIGEIGAGNGTFSLLLSLYNKNISLYINEINFGMIQYMEKKMNSYANVLSVDRIKLVLGEEYRTNFKAKTMDKIIIRNSFHHFTQLKPMLKSIKKSLKKDGELYIYEALPRLSAAKCLCNDIMTEEAIKASLKKGGFELEKEIIIDDVMIMKYKVAEKS